MNDKLIWKFTPNGEFSVRIVTWANNEYTSPHPKAKLLKGVWKLNLTPKLNSFA